MAVVVLGGLVTDPASPCSSLPVLYLRFGVSARAGRATDAVSGAGRSSRGDEAHVSREENEVIDGGGIMTRREMVDRWWSALSCCRPARSVRRRRTARRAEDPAVGRADRGNGAQSGDAFAEGGRAARRATGAVSGGSSGTRRRSFRTRRCSTTRTGETWVYTNPEAARLRPGARRRRADRRRSGLLSDRPAAGTAGRDRRWQPSSTGAESGVGGDY